MSGNGRVVIGRVTRPHALAGGVRVKPDGSMIASLEVGDPLRVAIEGQEPRDLTLAHRSGTAAAPILRFREIESRDDAEGIRGGLLSVSEEMVPSDPDGHTFLVRDLIGCTVFSGERTLGTVVDVHPGPANDSLEVKGEGAERLLLPFTLDAVREVALQERRLVIRPDLLGLDDPQ